jgi:hypothetical protein
VSASKKTPATATSGTPAPPRRRRRWLRRLIVLGIALALLSLSATWLLQPKQLVPLILDRAGKSLGLDITADANAEARLRGEPQLVVRNLVAREPGASTAILRAERLLLALPWSTLRSGGSDAVIKRVELDTPVLDVPALQAWLAKRPPGEETKIPVLTDGLRVANGRIDNDNWRIEGIAATLPSLHPEQPVDARIQGRYVDAPTAIPFDLAVALTKPANDVGIAVVGPLTIERGDWRLPATISLSGPLHLGDDALTVIPARLGVSARYESGDIRLPFSLGLHGPLRFDEATWVLAPVGVALRGDTPMPTLDAYGALALGRRLVIELDGALPQWPSSWPALPVPVSNSTSPLPFALRYAGTSDLSDIAGLRLRRDATDFDSRFRLYDVLGWIDQAAGAPLPPLDGHLRSPLLEISGATLEGVDIVLDDEDLPAP